MSSIAALREQFVDLHASGLFIIPNAWDAGSARILQSLGFPAIATTSSGHAASLGKTDQNVTRDELVAHVAALTAVLEIPLSVDAERCFADDPAGVAETVTLLADARAAGCSIEDYDPRTSRIDELAVAVERVAAAAEAAHRHAMVLTARAENHLYGLGDLDDTVSRLRAYRDAGADVVYAPGLIERDAIGRVVTSVDAPVNVLALRNAPRIAELAELGVRRVSTGGGLARAAYGSLAASARELRDRGTYTYLDAAMPSAELDEALG